MIVGGDDTEKDDWWMGQVIFCEGGARDPKVNSLVQVADVDTGVIRWINTDEVNTSALPRQMWRVCYCLCKAGNSLGSHD